MMRLHAYRSLKGKTHAVIGKNGGRGCTWCGRNLKNPLKIGEFSRAKDFLASASNVCVTCADGVGKWQQYFGERSCPGIST